jgi:hypothetical protein
MRAGALRAQIRVAGEVQSHGGPQVRIILIDLGIDGSVRTGGELTSIRARRCAPRSDCCARGGSWVTPAIAARLLAADTVPGVGEHPSIRVRRCAPGFG